MAESTITALTETTEADNGDFLVLDRGSETLRIQRNNLIPGRGSFSTIPANTVIDISNTRVVILDASDGRPREITVRDLVFGNFGNKSETRDFTLTPGIHNVQAVQIDSDSGGEVDEITLDGSTDGIAGADFYLVNMLAKNINVTATGITMNVGGIAVPSTTIGPYRSATITVKNDATRAIFEGGGN